MLLKKFSWFANLILIFSLITLGFALTHCASYDFARRNVEQGNLLPQKKITKLKIGMSKQEVAVLLGSSLLSPTFHNDRWDYVYTHHKGNAKIYIKYLSLYFVNDLLQKVELEKL